MTTKKAALSLLWLAVAAITATAQNVQMISYGNFDRWVTRKIKESRVLGGNQKYVFEIGPTQTIEGAKPYRNMGGSPWGTSNVLAKVAGVVKTSNAVFPEERGKGYCAKLTTMLEHAKAIGIINIDVLVSGSIFLGTMTEPVSSTKNPYSKMEMGMPFTKRPKYLQFDYKVTVPGGNPIYCSGFGKRKTLPGQDYAEVFVLLQRRWEDPDGSLHAARVGTGRERYGHTVASWQNGHRIPIMYGDITGRPEYKSYMDLINTKDRAYYARNSKGKMVPVIEEKWDEPDATPTHVVLMASSGCGTAYTGTVGMTLWVDNFAFVF